MRCFIWAAFLLELGLQNVRCVASSIGGSQRTILPFLCIAVVADGQGYLNHKAGINEEASPEQQDDSEFDVSTYAQHEEHIDGITQKDKAHWFNSILEGESDDEDQSAGEDSEEAEDDQSAGEDSEATDDDQSASDGSEYPSASEVEGSPSPSYPGGEDGDDHGGAVPDGSKPESDGSWLHDYELPSDLLEWSRNTDMTWSAIQQKKQNVLPKTGHDEQSPGTDMKSTLMKLSGVDPKEELPEVSSQAEVHRESRSDEDASKASQEGLYEVRPELEGQIPDRFESNPDLLKKHREEMELRGVIPLITGAVSEAVKFIKSGEEPERGNALWSAGRQVLLPIVMHDFTGQYLMKLDRAVLEIVKALPEHETVPASPEKVNVQTILPDAIELYKKFMRDASDDEMSKQLEVIITKLAKLLPDKDFGTVEAEANDSDDESHSSLHGVGLVEKERTPEEVQEEQKGKEKLRHLYKLWDKNKDGKVSKDELLKFAQEIQHELTSRTVNASLNLYDVNKDGLLSMVELGVIENGADDFEVSRFKAADANNDGLLDREELQCFFHPRSNSPSLKLWAQQTFHEKDINGDGKLTENEWSNHGPLAYEKSFAQLDKSGDGSLDLEEVMQYESQESKVQDAMTNFFKRTDQDNDGEINLAELETAWSGSATLAQRCHSSRDPHCYLTLWAMHKEL